MFVYNSDVLPQLTFTPWSTTSALLAPTQTHQHSPFFATMASGAPMSTVDAMFAAEEAHAKRTPAQREAQARLEHKV